jgi:hypothetical protein
VGFNPRIVRAGRQGVGSNPRFQQAFNFEPLYVQTISAGEARSGSKSAFSFGSAARCAFRGMGVQRLARLAIEQPYPPELRGQ